MPAPRAPAAVRAARPVRRRPSRPLESGAASAGLTPVARRRAARAARRVDRPLRRDPLRRLHGSGGRRSPARPGPPRRRCARRWRSPPARTCSRSGPASSSGGSRRCPPSAARRSASCCPTRSGSPCRSASRCSRGRWATSATCRRGRVPVRARRGPRRRPRRRPPRRRRPPPRRRACRRIHPGPRGARRRPPPGLAPARGPRHGRHALDIRVDDEDGFVMIGRPGRLVRDVRLLHADAPDHRLVPGQVRLLRSMLAQAGRTPCSR